MKKKTVHRFAGWVKYLNSYFPHTDDAVSYCRRIVKGDQTNLRPDARNVTCRVCKKAEKD